MTRDEKLLADVKALADDTLKRENVALARKLREMTQARDEWREAAQRYRKQLLEKQNDNVSSR